MDASARSAIVTPTKELAQAPTALSRRQYAPRRRALPPSRAGPDSQPRGCPGVTGWLHWWRWPSVPSAMGVAWSGRPTREVSSEAAATIEVADADSWSQVPRCEAGRPSPSQPRHRQPTSQQKGVLLMSDSDTPTVVLVHGGFVDGSGWQGVYEHLKQDGYNVSVVQNPTVSHADDVAVTKRVIDAQSEPSSSSATPTAGRSSPRRETIPRLQRSSTSRPSRRTRASRSTP